MSGRRRRRRRSRKKMALVHSGLHFPPVTAIVHQRFYAFFGFDVFGTTNRASLCKSSLAIGNELVFLVINGVGRKRPLSYSHFCDLCCLLSSTEATVNFFCCYYQSN